MKRELLSRARDGLPARLNAGILYGDGGACVLGWLLICAGFHPIKIYSFTIGVVDPEQGGNAIDVVAREYGLPREAVVALARLNDATPGAHRSQAVRERLTALLEGAGAGA